MSASLAVIVVAHESADELPATLSEVRGQFLDGDVLIVVDCGSTDGSAEVASEWADHVLRRPNLGFAGGCREGVAAAPAEALLLFLNPDAVPARGCLDALRTGADPSWGAWQAMVTLPDGREVNAAEGVVHFLGFGWAGGHGCAVDDVPATPHEVGFASGAALCVRRAAWDAVDGFDARYFMYGEDLDLSLRLRLAGWGVGAVPVAQVRHDYAFEKGDYKWFWLERNRWWTLLGAYPLPLLVLLTPALLAFELALVAAAFAGGWGRPKLRAQRAVLRELPAILARRRMVQATAAVDARTFAAGLVASLDSPFLGAVDRLPGARWLVTAYWRLVLALL